MVPCELSALFFQNLQILGWLVSKLGIDLPLPPGTKLQPHWVALQVFWGSNGSLCVCIAKSTLSTKRSPQPTSCGCLWDKSMCKAWHEVSSEGYGGDSIVFLPLLTLHDLGRKTSLQFLVIQPVLFSGHLETLPPASLQNGLRI